MKILDQNQQKRPFLPNAQETIRQYIIVNIPKNFSSGVIHYHILLGVPLRDVVGGGHRPKRTASQKFIYNPPPPLEKRNPETRYKNTNYPTIIITSLLDDDYDDDEYQSFWILKGQ